MEIRFKKIPFLLQEIQEIYNVFLQFREYIYSLTTTAQTENERSYYSYIKEQKWKWMFYYKSPYLYSYDGEYLTPIEPFQHPINEIDQYILAFFSDSIIE